MQKIDVSLGDALISVPADAAARAYLEKLLGAPLSTVLQPAADADYAPPIGCRWHGGIYAGLARGRDGAQDYHLIVSEELTGAEGADWEDATKLTKAMGDDWSLPYRKEQALCFANVPELFQPKGYWSQESYAGNDADAWGQYFGLGNQDTWRQVNALRARAVRRVVI